MEADDLIEEALKNSRGDRSVLEAVRDRLVNLIERGGQPPASDDEDPRDQGEFAVVAVSENVVQLTEALTRVNNQLVELVKIKSRQKNSKSFGGGSDDIYDMIEKGLGSTGS